VLEKNVITLSVSIQNPCLDDSTPMPVKTFTDVEIKVERTNESTDGDISGSFANISLPRDAKKAYPGGSITGSRAKRIPLAPQGNAKPHPSGSPNKAN